MGNTLREIIGAANSKGGNITDILSPNNRIELFFDNNPGEIVVQYDCMPDKCKNFINGLFAGGIIKSFE